MHRTLKHALGKEPAADKAALQMQLDAFVEHYNQQRPHEALQQSMPAQHYSDFPGPAIPPKLPELQYPKHWERVRVSHNGLIYWRALRVYIGYLLAGQWIGMRRWPLASGMCIWGRCDWAASTKRMCEDPEGLCELEVLPMSVS
ncbi:E3 SUMO-protein ligase PIAS1 [Manis javanica]|nr:E3 SUMO-protein ligase PIAS1 [Manis javanica]